MVDRQFDRQLLLALLALQNTLISEQQLLAAFRTWLLDKSRTLERVLIEDGALTASAADALQSLAALHVQQHGDTQSSLAVASLSASLKEQLSELADDEVDQSLPLVGSAATATSGDATSPVSLTLTLGQTTDAGRFQILRPHARGGLGEIFVARDGELDREVALKQIREKGADRPEIRERFLREAEITGKLEHPGVVPVYGLGTDEDGRPFYAMRLVRGENLRDAIRQYHEGNSSANGVSRRQQFRRLLGLFIDVCNAISYAHSRGVLHRDIKPSNVMIGRFGETLMVDWGLARALGEDRRTTPVDGVNESMVQARLSGNSSTTLDGQAVGTPAFMSPEQAEGQLEKIGVRSDVYCLGATLYNIVTGQPPLQGDVTEVLQRVIKGDIPPARQVNGTVRPALEAVCRKAMAVDPADRYATPLELAQDIEAWLADEPVSAWPEPLSHRARRMMRRHQTGFVTAAAVLVTVSLAMSAATAALQLKNRELSQAHQRESIARRRADQVKEYMVEAFRTEPTDDGERISVVTILDRARQDVASRFAKDSATRAEILGALGRGYYEVGRYNDAESCFDEEAQLFGKATKRNKADAPTATVLRRNRYWRARTAWQLGHNDAALKLAKKAYQDAKRKLGSEASETNDALGLYALCLKRSGAYKESIPLFETVLTNRKKTDGDESSKTLIAIHNLAVAYRDNGELKRSQPLLDQAYATSLRVYGERHWMTQLLLESLAAGHRRLGNEGTAISLYESVLASRRKSLGDDHPKTLSTMLGLAGVYQDRGEFEPAIELIQEALPKLRDDLGEEHRSTMNSWNTLGESLVKAGKSADAVPIFERLLVSHEKLLGGDHPNTVSIVNNLAYTYQRVGRLQEAIPLFERAHRQRSKQFGDDHEKTLIAFNNLALAYQSSGDLRKALPMLERAYDGWKRNFGEQHRNTLSSARYLGEGYRTAGEYEKAASWMEKTLATSREALGDEHVHTIYAMSNLCRVYLAQENGELALPLAQEAYATSRKKLGETHQTTGDALRTVAACHRVLDQLPEAEKVGQQALALLADSLAPSHPSVVAAKSSLGRTYIQLNKFAEAEPLYADIIEPTIQRVGSEHLSTLTLRHDLARCKRGLDDAEAAEEIWLSIWAQLEKRPQPGLPSEAHLRMRVAESLVSLYRANGDEDQLKHWQSVQETLQTTSSSSAQPPSDDP